MTDIEKDKQPEGHNKHGQKIQTESLDRWTEYKRKI